MNKNDFEKRLKEENLNINIEMSENLKDTPIVQNKYVKYKNKKLLLFPKFASICCALILIVCCGLFCFNKNISNDSTNLTSYIMEINPSICITADCNNKIVNVCALNEDANAILSNAEMDNIIGEEFALCINKIMKVISDEGYFENYENTIKLYAINDNKETRTERLNQFEGIMQKNLEDLGYGHIPFEKQEMEMEDFKEKMGFEEDFNTLDDMHDFLKNKDKHHTPFENPEPNNHSFDDMQDSQNEEPPISEEPNQDSQNEQQPKDESPHNNAPNNEKKEH